MIKNRILALLLVSAFSTGASAAMVTVDAGHYNFTYDDSFWNGAAFSRSGDIFTFSNLSSALGTSASASLNHPDVRRSVDFGVQRGYWPSPPITITADSGYKLVSVLTGATGSLTATAGSDPANTLVTSASSVLGFSNRWLSGAHGVQGTSTGGAYYEERRFPSGEVLTYANPDSFVPGSFDFSDTTTFFNNTTSVFGEYSAFGEVRVEGKGSSALAFLDTAYFNVAVLPIPEPETWAMFLGGLGVLGVVARRRRRTEA